MKRLVAVAILASGCTIDPVARAELAGTVGGAAIFQKAGTSSQVSFEITLDGEDGTYNVAIEDGVCDGGTTEWKPAGPIDVVGRIGILRGVRTDWDVGGGETDVIGRLVVVRRGLAQAGCGPIFNSD